MSEIHGVNTGAISYADGPQLDAFHRLRVSAPFGLAEFKFLTGRKRAQWQERLTGVILVHGTITGTPFAIGDTLIGFTSGMEGTVTAVGSGNVTITTSANDWTDGEPMASSGGGSAPLVSHNTGADLTYSYDTASVLLSVGTVSGQRVIRQTNRYFPYVPGFSQLINMTGTFAAPKANLKQTLMYGDDLNGIGYVMEGTAFKVLLRSSTSGSAADTLVAQSDWNIDRLNIDYGLNPSGLTLDATKSQIEGMDFQWLGVGRVRMVLNVGGQPVPVHEFNHSNVLAGVYMRTPTLPIRYEIENTGATASASTLEQICCSVSSEGGYALPGIDFTAGHTWAQEVAVTTRRPIFAIRLKAAWPAGKPNRKQLKLRNFGGFSRTNDALFELVHVHNPLTMTATWTPVDSAGADDSSGAEYSADISALTADHMHRVEFQVVPAGLGSTSTAAVAEVRDINAHSYLSQNFESDNSDMFVVYATSRASTANCTCHLTFTESE